MVALETQSLKAAVIGDCLNMLTAYFDGSISVNPNGKATFGYRIYRQGHEIASGSGTAMSGPGATNNLAEYTGLIAVLEALAKLQLPREAIQIISDSQIVVQGVRWGHTDKSPHLTRLRESAKELWTPNTTLGWKPREENKAHDLAEGALGKNAPPQFVRSDLYEPEPEPRWKEVERKRKQAELVRQIARD